MIKRLCITVILAAALVLMATPVWGGYFTHIIVESTGPDYTKLAMNLTLDVDYLVDEGYITPSGLDTRVTDSGYNILPHMLVEDRLMWVSDLAGGKKTQFMFFTQQEALQSFPVITGHGGHVTVADNDGLELGDVYAIGFIGYINTAEGVDKNIVRKDGTLSLYVSAANNLTFAVTGGTSLVASNVTPKVYTIMIYCDGDEMWMDIDDVERDRKPASAATNTTSTWYLFENNVCPYVYYFSMWRYIES